MVIGFFMTSKARVCVLITNKDLEMQLNNFIILFQKGNMLSKCFKFCSSALHKNHTLNKSILIVDNYIKAIEYTRL